MMHAVYLDEAHEMLINKDIKTSVMRPSKEYLNRIMYYYTIRSKLFKQLEQQVSVSHINKESLSIFDNTSHSIHYVENVRAITIKLYDMHVFDSRRHTSMSANAQACLQIARKNTWQRNNY